MTELRAAFTSPSYPPRGVLGAWLKTGPAIGSCGICQRRNTGDLAKETRLNVPLLPPSASRAIGTAHWSTSVLAIIIADRNGLSSETPNCNEKREDSGFRNSGTACGCDPFVLFPVLDFRPQYCVFWLFFVRVCYLLQVDFSRTKLPTKQRL